MTQQQQQGIPLRAQDLVDAYKSRVINLETELAETSAYALGLKADKEALTQQVADLQQQIKDLTPTPDSNGQGDSTVIDVAAKEVPPG